MINELEKDAADVKREKLLAYLRQRKKEIVSERLSRSWYVDPALLPPEMREKVARPAQYPPEDKPEKDWQWRYWLLLGGRGSGKTRAAAEYARYVIKQGVKSLFFIARTEADNRDTQVQGDSGILAVWDAKNDKDIKTGKVIGHPTYLKQSRQVVFPNGATIYLYSTNRPDRLRGPQSQFFWWDEYAAAMNLNEVWNNLMLTFRKNSPIGLRGVVSTTPRPLPSLKRLMENKKCVITRMTTYDNRANLAENFITDVIEPMEGTFLHKQEIQGIFKMALPGALWNPEQLDAIRVNSVDIEQLDRIVVAVDPAVTAEEKSNETGIIVAGSAGKRGYVLEDLSGVMKPSEWVNRAVEAYRRYKADYIVAEKNQGGDLISHAFNGVDEDVPLRLVTASRGKRARAEPVALLYEKGRVFHAGKATHFEEMETQMATWVPGEVGVNTNPSLDRVDAMVWALTYLLLKHHEDDSAHTAPAPVM